MTSAPPGMAQGSHSGFTMLRGLLLLMLSVPATAAEVFVVPRISSLGAGAEVAIGVNDRVDLRLGGGAIGHERPLTWDEIDFDGDLELRNAGLVLDFYPSRRDFRLSLGAIFNDNSFTGRSNENTVIEINGVRYPVALVGTIDGRITTDRVGPYVGMGWGRPRGGKRIRLFAELGAYYHGEPAVELTAVPHFGIPLPQRYLEDLEAEEREIESELRDYRVLPVVTIGVAIRLR